MFKKLLLSIILSLGLVCNGFAAIDYQQPITTQSLANATGNGTATGTITGFSVIAVDIVDAGVTSFTVVPEGLFISGGTYRTIPCYDVNNVMYTSFIQTGPNDYRCNVTGLLNFRTRISAIVNNSQTITIKVSPVAGGSVLNSGNNGIVLASSSQNLLFNGNWLIDQINEGAAYTQTGGAADVQSVDGWSGSGVAVPGVFTIQQVADPDNIALKALLISCTTIDATIAATDNYFMQTAIEGYDVAALMSGTTSAQYITISFKTKSNKAGTYGISITNSAKNRSYVGTFTVVTANEEWQTVTLQLDTTGTWLYTNGNGLIMRICLACGANFQTTAGAWGANNMFTTSGQVNFMDTNTNTLTIKRIQLVQGTIALPFQPQNFNDDLRKAQRYYWKTFSKGVAVAQSSASVIGAISYKATIASTVANCVNITFPVTMSTNPTITYYSSASANTTWRNVNDVGDSGASSTIATAGMDGFSVCNAQVVTDGVGEVLQIHATANARLL